MVSSWMLLDVRVNFFSFVSKFDWQNFVKDLSRLICIPLKLSKSDAVPFCCQLQSQREAQKVSTKNDWETRDEQWRQNAWIRYSTFRFCCIVQITVASVHSLLLLLVESTVAYLTWLCISALTQRSKCAFVAKFEFYVQPGIWLNVHCVLLN